MRFFVKVIALLSETIKRAPHLSIIQFFVVGTGIGQSFQRECRHPCTPQPRSHRKCGVLPGLDHFNLNSAISSWLQNAAVNGNYITFQQRIEIRSYQIVPTFAKFCYFELIVLMSKNEEILTDKDFSIANAICRIALYNRKDSNSGHFLWNLHYTWLENRCLHVLALNRTGTKFSLQCLLSTCLLFYPFHQDKTLLAKH